MAKLLLNEQPLVVLPELACKIGLNEAIILQQLNYWLNKSTRSYDGRTWVYNTYSDWQKQFPWWSISTIKRSLSTLKKMGLIITGNYNLLPQDRTIWYTIDFDKINELANKKDNAGNEPGEEPGEEPLGQNEPMGSSTPPSEGPLGQNEPMGRSNCTNASGQNEPMQEVKMSRPLPETTTETTNREQQHSHSDLVSTSNDRARDVVVSLENIGMEKGVIQNLIISYDIEIIQEWVKVAKTKKNPAGFVREALEKGWPLPAGMEKKDYSKEKTKELFSELEEAKKSAADPEKSRMMIERIKKKLSGRADDG
jgi:hypothetical protein